MNKTLSKITLLLFLVTFTFECTAQSKIDTTETLEIGGIKQVIKLVGADRLKPLFLFITGGPGLPGIYDETSAFTNELEKHFVVVQWDQRNTGQTMALNPSPVKLTVELYENDTHELITKLLKQYHRKKLALMGWSWGTVLGFYMAGNYPDLLYAYMAVSPVTNQSESEQLALHMLQQKATADNNTLAIKELSKVKIPFENSTQMYYDRKWLMASSGADVSDTTGLKQYFIDNAWVGALFDKAGANNLMVTLPRINCPVYFFVGRKDYQTNFMLSEKYYNEVKAPKKQLFWFEQSGHLIPFSEPALLQKDVIDQILPQLNMVD
jgi:pimeloyl-ACP methyl ester carboxylesterase